MKKKFTESQIVATLKKQEAGIPVKEICRELGTNTWIYTTLVSSPKVRPFMLELTMI